MYQRILYEELSFPPFLTNAHLIDLLQKLLAKDPQNRIEDISEIKDHPWFDGVDWKKHYKKEISPLFIPSMRESNFDPEFNELPIDFDEIQLKVRQSTERRQSYYYESTLQSKTCTENSFYFN